MDLSRGDTAARQDVVAAAVEPSVMLCVAVALSFHVTLVVSCLMSVCSFVEDSLHGLLVGVSWMQLKEHGFT